VIINIRGTSGSGKSTLVTQVMNLYLGVSAVYTEDRRKPFGYYCLPRGDGAKPLWILGHYETACGGCDTIKNMDDVFASAVDHGGRGNNVLFEGIMISGEYKRAVDLGHKFPAIFLVLTTPIDVCIERINQRRQLKGKTDSVVPDRTVRRMGEVNRMAERLKVNKLDMRYVTEGEAFEICKKEFEL
jgi:thymidylate kinase